MKQKSKTKNPSVEQIASWERTAAQFEDQAHFPSIAKSSRVLSASEKRKLFGSGKTKAISVRLPEEDLLAVKELAQANDRPYQQLVVVAVQQYLDRVAHSLRVKKPEDNEVA